MIFDLATLVSVRNRRLAAREREQAPIDPMQGANAIVMEIRDLKSVLERQNQRRPTISPS